MFPSNFDPIKSEANHLIYHADTDKVSYLDNIITIDIIMLYPVGQLLLSFNQCKANSLMVQSANGWLQVEQSGNSILVSMCTA